MNKPYFFSNVSPDIWITDDGTLDTVVAYYRNEKTEHHRFDSDYRFSFENDDAFLKSVKEALDNE